MFKKKSKSSKAPAQALEVCLIGCGPAGMMFMHALNERKKTEDPKFPLPRVTCYERASSPGGLWRDVPKNDPNRTRDENKCLMYEDMWTNVAKELMEFPDYTYDDHFKKPMPAFLPRGDILEYLIARNSKDGALDNVIFNTEVREIKYDKKTGKFTLLVADLDSGETSVSEFDRCIYAGGVQIYPEEPAEVVDVLKDFKGKVMHSMACLDNFEADVKGKTVLMIGDSCSAEDLSLRAVKMGVKKVYVAARRGVGDCSECGNWPEDKVEVIYTQPQKVLKDGNGFRCQPIYWSEKRQKWRRDDEEEVTKLKDIDVVILCTGYDYDFEAIAEDVRVDLEETWQVSKNWKMDNNSLTITLGSPVPNANLWVGATTYCGLYHNLLIKNPNMMYLVETPDSYSPLLDLDVASWLLISYLSGEVKIPGEKDMKKSNQKQLEGEMQIPFMRMSSDYEYFAEFDEMDENHWSDNSTDERTIVLERMDKEFKAKRLARDMKLGKYPADFGKWEKLSAAGERYINLCVQGERSRSFLKKDSPGAAWRTFRDSNDFISVFSGTKAAALPGPWLKLNKDPKAPAKFDNYS